jgi:hypothetical protein
LGAFAGTPLWLRKKLFIQDRPCPHWISVLVSRIVDPTHIYGLSNSPQ